MVFKKGCIINIGEKNSMWKGDKVQYCALHDWIRRRKPKPQFCEKCRLNLPYDLANISGQYKRDINDFEWLCRKCHMKSDNRLNKLKQISKDKKVEIDMEKLRKLKELPLEQLMDIFKTTRKVIFTRLDKLNGEYKCPICNKVFKNRKGFTNHVRNKPHKEGYNGF